MMQKFIKSILLFSLILVGLLLGFIVTIKYVVNKNADFNLKEKPAYIVLGHSHPECAFNDSLINDFVNLAESGEAYYYTLFKTKKIIEQNPSIKVVFIEFTNNQINESMNNWIWSDRHLNSRYAKYAPFIDVSDNLILAKNNFSGYLKSQSLSLKENIGRTLKQNFNYTGVIGGYNYLVRDKTDSLVNVVITKPAVPEKVNISDFHLDCLTRIIKYCEEKGKKVLLIRSPQHEKFVGYSNESQYQEIRNKKYSDIEYLDFSNFPLSNNEFGDLHHLNYKGAKVFSNWFSNILDKGLIDKIDKRAFIVNEMKAHTISNVISE
jgi:hypothetical protein